MPETTTDQRGILYPSRLPTFHREPVSEALADRVRWIWIPRWDLPAGQRERQEVLPFPACNLVVEPDGISLYGPTTSISYRELEGRGWAVGALLRPAGAGALCSPSLIRDSHRPLEDPDLKVAVADAMADSNTTTGGQCAASALAAWVAQYTGLPQAMALTANRMEDVVASDRSILRVDQLARRLDLSIRSLQRISERYIGLPPLAVIRRYRLQEAAQRLREDPSVTVAQVAAELDYADHAHLTADFRRVLGLSPSRYRQQTISDRQALSDR
ncbi:helix-turn-helix domain-containing protein [Actinomyces naeslundii]|uniref:helix-turn-helix domain-containing protein n=1 Tax=Actinomyces naeslundii TaxID=1655 RepID=UPI00096C0C00|nr:helix-turn-helix domain-containing protein [Actinomyces naeslundii]OMG19515.1 DNA-binding protein [Actinomyces naeslundii]